MKKLLTTIVIVTIITGVNFAQTTVNLITGINSASTDINSSLTEVVDVQPIKNLTIGLKVDQRLDRHLSVTTGIISKSKGFQIQQSTGIDLLGMDLPIGAKVVNQIKYIEVPLLLTYNIKPVSGIEPYVSLGPSLSYARSGTINTKVQAAIFDVNVTSTPLVLTSDDYNRTQVVGNAVAGLKLPYGRGHWVAEVGYSRSFTELVSDNFRVDAGGIHTDWNFSVGYGISF